MLINMNIDFNQFSDQTTLTRPDQLPLSYMVFNCGANIQYSTGPLLQYSVKNIYDVVLFTIIKILHIHYYFSCTSEYSQHTTTDNKRSKIE